MKLYGLIGYPLSHSFSQTYFRKKFSAEGLSSCDYINFPLKDISEISEIIKNQPELLGFNVTIPYKEQIIKYLDEIDIAANEIAAVNTVKIIRVGDNKPILKGYNTDVHGFEQSLKPFLSKKHKHALILGTGGAAKAVAFVLKQLNINYRYVSRKTDINQALAYNKLSEKDIKGNLLIINTTPLGMFPKTELFPDIPYQYIGKEHILFDLIYNPEKTKFLEKGEINGATIINGSKMLEIQAGKAWEIFIR